ncbi:PhzF family phenazine biosynthesis protein [Jannaschia sp. W003]|uniref:PhzF family phenazine biosynthesis protein n=1 Tax=Jannaschia sp. W003 TaxID=2867012 RepID=UPI0021A5585E|nr:PhzF family phenazine biosynthesis protein [Jannaschia sp. W003]UWQ21147.1 PhzF family phenazine biosynthesis protein [Jannaschia sp. W003]
MRLPIAQVDAFARGPFTGNPAAVVEMDAWLPDATLLAIAAENNLAETAFLRGQGAERDLRWFTPAVEVALCGHATLASAHVVLADPALEEARFRTRKAGTLVVRRDGDALLMRLPRIAVAPVAAPEGLAAALGAAPREVLRGHYAADEWDEVAVFGTEAEVAALAPDFRALKVLGGGQASRGVICTAPAERDGDFVSRYFAPAAGIDEDPFTGSAHCLLAPFWAGRLGRDVLAARQISARVGWAVCRVEADAVMLRAEAVTYLRGEIEVPG